MVERRLEDAKVLVQFPDEALVCMSVLTSPITRPTVELSMGLCVTVARCAVNTVTMSK
jgi:hypothetical protein